MECVRWTFTDSVVLLLRFNLLLVTSNAIDSPVFMDIMIGDTLRPENHSFAPIAGTLATVSGYRSLWKRVDLRGTIIEIGSQTLPAACSL
uniref:Putative secreted protein n=1 Tax=Anopheles darlingi TaxID=43151 RepID=A0A2M4DHN9_ANODA